jgi:hypothetical protein
LSEAASTQVSLADASAIMAGAFAGWASGAGICFPSIAVTALAPTASTTIGYDLSGPNENIVVFMDEGLGPDATHVIERPTITYNLQTGEILDVDVQINTSLPFTTEDSVDAGDSFDLRYVMTHEAGHFLGLAHSVDHDAVMFPQTTPGSKARPWITEDDARGLCAIYPQNGTRTTTDAAGASIAVNATPCNLVVDACSGEPVIGHGCSFRAMPRSASFGRAATLTALFIYLIRRRPHPHRRSTSIHP